MLTRAMLMPSLFLEGTYFASNDPVTSYYAAKQWCKANGGDPAMPKTRNENLAAFNVCDAATPGYTNGKCFLGLSLGHDG